MNNYFQLGSYTVHPKHNKITHHKKIVKLEPKIMQVLCLLVQCRGLVLSRQDIANRLWPDTIVGVEVITRAIFELRQVFEDDPKKPKFIETISRKGYCFIGEIEPVIDDNYQSKNSSILATKVTFKKVIMVSLLLAIIMLPLLIYTIKYFNSPQGSMPTPTNYQATILSDGIGDIQSAALSPDWSQILYIQTDFNSGESALILKDVTSLKYSILKQGNELYRSVIWAEQSNTGYFIQCDASDCIINKLFIGKSDIQQIYKTDKQLKSIELSPSGKILALTTMNNHRLSISLLSLNTQRLIPLKLDKKVSHYAAKFNNTESEIFYVQQGSDQATINRYNLQNQQSTIVSIKFSKITSIHLEDEYNLLVAGKIDSLYAVWRLNLKTNQSTQALSIPASTHAYELASNENSQQLFYLKKSSNFNISAQGLAKKIDLELVNSHANDFNAIWSTQTDSLYFVSQRTGNYEVWSHNNDKNNKLTTIKADSIRRPILNNNQSQLAFVVAKNNQLKLMIYDIEMEQLIVSENIAKEAHLLSWSTDSNFIYMSIASENIYDIWQFDVASKESKKILLAAGLLAKEQSDNSFIFGDLTSQQLMLKKQNGTTSILKSFKDIALQFRPHSIKLNNQNDHLYYVERQSSNLKVMLSPIGEVIKEKPKELFTLSTNDNVTDLGRQGTHYVLYDHLLSKRSQLLLLEAVN